MSPRLLLRSLLAAALCATLGCEHLRGWVASDRDARLVGRVSSLTPDAPRGPIAVFLERIDPAPPGDALEAVLVAQRHERFEPEFAVVAVGQPVLFVNRDQIFHAAFSYSPRNAFDCPALPPGEICMVTFREPGLVRIYSPLDSEERGALLVVPGPHHAIPDARGDFRIEGVSAGRYRVTVWSEQTGTTTRELTVAEGATTQADFTLSLR